MAKWPQIGIEYGDYQDAYLPKAPAGMITQQLTEMISK